MASRRLSTYLGPLFGYRRDLRNFANMYLLCAPIGSRAYGMVIETYWR